MPHWLFLAAAAFAGGSLEEPAGSFPVETVEVIRSMTQDELVVRFPSPLTSPFSANNQVWAHLVLPRRSGPLPAVLLLPVMAAPNVWIERRFINRLTREGFAVLWLEMPYQFNRRPHSSQPSGQVFLARTPERLAANFRQSVLDARRALTWLSSLPMIDKDRIGLFGISLGALVGSVTYSVDSRPRYAVFLLGGAEMPSLVAQGSMTAPFVRRTGIRLEDLRRSMRGLDPLDYPVANADKKALLINVESDTIIPKANALKLKEAFPSSRQVWLPLGHYSAILHLLWIPSYVARDMGSHLGSLR